jgi:hypothetical protein
LVERPYPRPRMRGRCFIRLEGHLRTPVGQTAFGRTGTKEGRWLRTYAAGRSPEIPDTSFPKVNGRTLPSAVQPATSQPRTGPYAVPGGRTAAGVPEGSCGVGPGPCRPADAGRCAAGSWDCGPRVSWDPRSFPAPSVPLRADERPATFGEATGLYTRSKCGACLS